MRQPYSFAPTTQTPVFSRSTATGARDQAENLLREMAFVLHLTRSVKQDILAEGATADLASFSLTATDDSN